MRKSIALILAIVFAASVFGQQDTARKKVYKMHLAWELPASGAAILLSNVGFRRLDKVSIMTEEEVARLNKNDVNGFDRSGGFFNPANYASAQKASDFFLNFSLVSPVVLALDKNIRKDWLDLITLYLASHTVDNSLYFLGTFPVRRPRPLTYMTEIPIKERTGEGKSNSFFSGHVSFATTATFFAAKVYTDYHQIKGWKRILIFAGASVPPALVGYYRMKAGKHFKTDVLTGFLAGATSGILVPELHRIIKKHDNLSLAPYYAPNGGGGLTLLVGLGGKKKVEGL
ncbi:phosphatase PAP2 family protein [Foetidibacter luteolus]|uniref:phosphatase PAP2 family protein n=1 Tax=Foetidibacter luteolus TaxID=2608880 RepID=UPI00129A19B1|nr:phosphatase PAP2 family protein [Foetidibacter luteolus]